MRQCGTWEPNQFDENRKRGTRVSAQRRGSRVECACGRMVRALDRICKCGAVIKRRKKFSA